MNNEQMIVKGWDMAQERVIALNDLVGLDFNHVQDYNEYSDYDGFLPQQQDEPLRIRLTIVHRRNNTAVKSENGHLLTVSRTEDIQVYAAVSTETFGDIDIDIPLSQTAVTLDNKRAVILAQG